MLKLRMFSIFDDKAAAFIQPFFLPSNAVAMRAFGNGVADAGHEFGRNPQDYTLFALGEFDVGSGKVTAYPTMEAICNGLELRARMEADALRVQERLKLVDAGGDPRDRVGVNVSKK